MENIREFYEVYANYANKPSERVAGYSKETALKVIDDETVDIYLVNPKAPCFIRDSQENYIYLILPVNFSA